MGLSVFYSFHSFRPASAHLGTDVFKRGWTHEREADEENVLMGKDRKQPLETETTASSLVTVNHSVFNKGVLAISFHTDFFFFLSIQGIRLNKRQRHISNEH